MSRRSLFGDARSPNEKKFRELILFIAERSEGDSAFGATKLNKLLFFSDFAAFRQLGKAITWQSYQKLEWGPAPKRLLPVMKKMEDAGEVTYATRRHYGKPQKRAIALREPDLALFSAEEISIVQQVIDELWNDNAVTVSDISHAFVGWAAARMNEMIPYELALVDVPEPNTHIVNKCKQLESAARKFLNRGASS